MINISEAAQIHLHKLLKKQVKGTQIRVFVTNPGTVDAECGISYCLPNDVKDNDTLIKFKKISVYIDEISLPYLYNAEINLVINKLDSYLTLNAPNVKVDDFFNNDSLIERVDYFLKSQINPQLANHGGYVSLIKITNDGYAVIKFNGGCNGCSMVNFTLKEGIEKKLLNNFSELKGIRDVTNHLKGNHSYFK